MKPANDQNAREDNARGRKHGDGYDEEAVYQYFKEAGGNVAQAMRLADGDPRVPRDKHTWSSCIGRMGYQERYRQETEQEWQEFGQERQRMLQYHLDTVAESFEQYLHTFTGMLRQALKAIRDKGDEAGLLLLRKDFAFGINQFDKLFRMYLRAMGKPEHITGSIQPERPVITFKTLTSGERQKLLRRNDGIVPQPKNAHEALKMIHRVKLMMDDED